MLELVMNSMKQSINENQKCYEGHKLRYIELKCGLKEIQQRVPASSSTGRLFPVRGQGAYASKREFFKPRYQTWNDSKLHNRIPQSPIQPIRINFIYVRPFPRGTQRQFSENICSEHDLRSRIFGTYVVKFLACLPLLGFSKIYKMV